MPPSDELVHAAGFAQQAADGQQLVGQRLEIVAVLLVHPMPGKGLACSQGESDGSAKGSRAVFLGPWPCAFHPARYVHAAPAVAPLLRQPLES